MNLLKNALKYIIVFILMIIVSWSALYITCLIPRDRIYAKSLESAKILDLEHDVYKMYLNLRTVPMHNYTDAIMLNTVYSIDTDNIVESIIKCRRDYLPEKKQNEMGEKLGNLVGDNDTYYMVNEYLNTVKGISRNSYEYGRYWHGYMVFLRPLLLIFNVTQIRAIFSLVLFISLAILALYLGKNSNKKVAISVIIAFIAMDVTCFYSNIQGVLVMLIAVITSIFVANKKINLNNINIILFVVGGLTSYLDFLTTPLITFLLPITIFYVVNRECNMKAIVKQYILTAIAWGCGYVLLWAVKWIICDMVYNSGMIKLSFEQIIFRMNSPELSFERYASLFAIMYNIIYAINPINLTIFMVAMSYIIVNANTIVKKYKLPYVMSGILALAWYAVFANHSVQHSLYTYRLLVVPLICLLFIMFDDKEIENKEN